MHKRSTCAAALLLLVPHVATGHFLWLSLEPDAGGATVRLFLNEEPRPGAEKFLEFVEGAVLAVDGHSLALAEGATTLDARWAGALPVAFDARRDMGIRESKGVRHRLVYTARAQTRAEEPGAAAGTGLVAHLIERDSARLVEVLFDGKPLAGARIRMFPASGEPRELTADAGGIADVPELLDGTAGLFATHVDASPGELGGEHYSETRHYATLTVRSTESSAVPAFAVMPEPAVNSFGGAVLGHWLYVYSGHIGRMHRYHEGTTARHFRRLDLRDGTTWEELPMGRDLQGVALVPDGRFLYRTGGMAAQNSKGEPEDTRSVADCARFDPETRTWTDLPPLPEARSTHDSIVSDGVLYVAGGWTLKGLDGDAEYCSTALALDLAQPAAGWRSIPQPFQRRALALAAAGGRLYVLGGLTAEEDVARQVDVYDVRAGTWSRGPDLPGSDEVEGFGPSACAVGDDVYYSGATGVVFRLGAGGNAWEAVGALSEPRITHRLLPGLDGTLLAVGGNCSRIQTPRIERLALAPPAPAGG